MPDVVYTLDEAKTSLLQLVDRAARGEEIIIAQAGERRAKLVPISKARKPRKSEGSEGQVVISVVARHARQAAGGRPAPPSQAPKSYS